MKWHADRISFIFPTIKPIWYIKKQSLT